MPDVPLKLNLTVMTPLNLLAAEVHRNAITKGFYDEGATAGFDGMLMNIASEAFEAHRMWREGRDIAHVWYEEVGPPNIPLDAEWNDKLEALRECDTKPEGIPVEIIDVIIRALDTLAMIGVDIDDLFRQKMAYNATRPYRHGGRRS